ncbi:unnamed protein product [Cunninghamella echinulata]
MNKSSLLFFSLFFSSIKSIIATTTTTTTSTATDISWIHWIFSQIGNIISTMITISQLPMLPFIWLTQWLWQQLVITPYHMAIDTTTILYPIFVYCAAACFCGVLIGGCSGFAAEAIITMFINATWGKEVANQNRKKKLIPSSRENDYQKEEEKYNQEEEDEEDEEEEEEDYHHRVWHRPSIQSPTSSLYRLSMSTDTSFSFDTSAPSSFYDNKPEHWHGDEDPEEIASFLRQRRKLQQQQQQQQS